MEKTMFLKDVLKEMKKLDILKNPIPFSLKVRQYNRQNKSGGKIKSYENVTLLQQPQKTDKIAVKNPNHWENKTRNIKLANKKIEKINILFIIEFNGRKVVY
ncbi:hypothetical protein CAPN008_11830 [Capnocytophaga canis]|nr:hypothetical protein CAPN008_11830 [Capnocytophaga canis]